MELKYKTNDAIEYLRQRQPDIWEKAIVKSGGKLAGANVYVVESVKGLVKTHQSEINMRQRSV